MIKDPDFVAATAKRNSLIDAAAGEEMDAITRETISLPESTKSSLKNLLKD
jgi:hypothetical protein